MNENPKANGSPRRFLEEKGFYIILFLCAAAIGIAGYVLFAQPFNDDAAADESEFIQSDAAAVTDTPYRPHIPIIDEINPPVSDVDPVYVPEDEADLPVSEHSAEDETALQTAADAVNDDEPAEPVSAAAAKPQPETQETVKKKNEPSKEPTFFVKPVSGEVLKNFSVTELVYDRTMGDWRTHNGVDISASNGQPVSVIADGTVAGIYNDEFYGTCVRVDHGGGLVSVYFGLAENATVKVGDAVSAGDTIGAVSIDTLFESLEPVHLHLEVTRNGEFIDPVTLLPG